MATGANLEGASQTILVETSGYQVAPPDKFDFGNPAQWTKWLCRFDRYRIATRLNRQPEEEQVNSLIYLMGEQADEIFMALPLSEQEKADYKKVVAAFEKYFVVRINVIYERAKFNTRVQLEGEMVEGFITSLHTLARNCNYGELRQEMIRDRIVVGIRDKRLSDKLQCESELTLEKAIDTVRTQESVRRQQNELAQGCQIDTTVNKVRAIERNVVNEQCEKCGGKHGDRIICAAKGKKCNKCYKFGHFARVCKSGQRMNNIEMEKECEVETMYFGMVSNNGKNDRWCETIKINKKLVKVLIDTGAPVDVLPTALFYKNWPNTKTIKADKRLTGPSGEALMVKGMCKVEIEHGNNVCKSKIYIVDNIKNPLLSLGTCEKLKFINRVNKLNEKSTVDINKEFPNLYNSLGCLEFVYDIKLKKEQRPYAIHAARRVPIPVMEKLRNKLAEMVNLGVIKRVDVPTEWCAPLVIVPKANGEIRPCVDLSKLNDCIEREIHPMPMADHTLAQLSDAKYFTKLDTKNGFWQIRLSVRSRNLTTFITPFGRYCFLRLPFGISSAPEVFQRQIQRILEDLKGVVCQTDDILVFGRTIPEHDENLRKVLKRLSTANVTLNRDKCEVGITSVKFLGHFIDSQGIHPDESKIKAIQEYPRPTNTTEVRRFLGLVQYLAKFVPNLSTVCQPLNDLLKKNIDYQWNESQQKSFVELKKCLSTPPTLKRYSPNHKTSVSTDASSYGLGAVLRQIDDDGFWKPVAYASRTLSESEQRYAQIEKEALAITWAITEKFRDFLTGIRFNIETDHKPLISIFTVKHLDDLTPRIQKFRMKLLCYGYTIEYTPGKDLIAADALSRAPLEIPKQADDEDLITFVNHIVENFQASDDFSNKLKVEQQDDSVLKEVTKYCNTGWPHKSKLSSEVKLFSNDRYKIAVNNGFLMYGERMIIPASMRQEVLERIHNGHLGINKCKARTRNSVWWPGCMDSVEKLVRECRICIQSLVPRREPMIISEFPERPWQKVGIDLCYFKGKNFLIVCDYYSRYPEVMELEKQTAGCVINKLKSIFARHGVPEEVRSDNGPQFSQIISSEFHRFAKDWGFRHTTSSPYFSQSNGLAESAVKITKHLFKKNLDPYMALLEYRASPLSSGFSPSELLMGRKLRSKLPMINSQLAPKCLQRDEIAKNEEEKRLHQADNYNRRHGVHKRPDLENDSEVWVRDLQQWGQVESKANTPRSYWIRTDDGRYRRNAFHLNRASDNKDTTTNINLRRSSVRSTSFGERGNDELNTSVPTDNTSRTFEEPQSAAVPDDRLVAANDIAAVPSQDTRTTRLGRTITTPARFNSYVLDFD